MAGYRPLTTHMQMANTKLHRSRETWTGGGERDHRLHNSGFDSGVPATLYPHVRDTVVWYRRYLHNPGICEISCALLSTKLMGQQLGTVAMTALEIVGYERYDWGRHIWCVRKSSMQEVWLMTISHRDVPINNVSRSLYISWWYRIVYSAVACFTRMALIFFYYRITPGGSAMRVFRRWIHLVAVFSAATGLMLVFATIFQCSPIRAMWTWPPVQGARCINEGRWTFVCGIINTIADIFVVVLPIPIIYKLRLPLRKRIGAIVLVSLGFLVCIVGIVRAYFVWLSLIHSYDVTWNGYGALVAATVEIHVGLVSTMFLVNDC